jgi:hypothetical protein
LPPGNPVQEFFEFQAARPSARADPKLSVLRLPEVWLFWLLPAIFRRNDGANGCPVGAKVHNHLKSLDLIKYRIDRDIDMIRQTMESTT